MFKKIILVLGLFIVKISNSDIDDVGKAYIIDGVPYGTKLGRYPICENCTTEKHNDHTYIKCKNCRIEENGFISAKTKEAHGICKDGYTFKIGLFGIGKPRFKCCKNGHCENAISKSDPYFYGRTEKDDIRCFIANSLYALRCINTCPQDWPVSLPAFKVDSSKTSSYFCYISKSECEKQNPGLERHCKALYGSK